MKKERLSATIRGEQLEMLSRLSTELKTSVSVILRAILEESLQDINIVEKVEKRVVSYLAIS